MTTTLVWNPAISQALNVPELSGPEGLEILGNFLYATDLFGSDIDIYDIDPTTGAFSYRESYGSQGSGAGQFGAFGPLDMAFYQLSDGSTKVYTPDAGNLRIAALDVDVTTGNLSWDATNTLEDVGQLTAPYGIEINGNFLYSTDWGASNIDIYQIDPDTGGLSYVRSFGSQGSGINQFSVESPLDIAFLKLESGQVKAYVPDSQNQRVVILNVNETTGELTWDSALTLPESEPSTNQYGVEIYESTLYVNKYDVGVLLYDIDLQTGRLTFSHAVGSKGSGDGQFLTPIDTSFYTSTDGVTHAYIPDSTNRRITAFTVDADFAVSESNVIRPGLNTDSQLTISLTDSHLEDASEVVLIRADAADGSVNGVGIEEEGYLAAAKEEAQVIFSVLKEDDFVADFVFERTVDIASDDYLNFAVIEGGSLQDALNDPTSVEVRFGAQILSGEALSENQTRSVNNAPIRIGLDDFSTVSGEEDVAEGVELAIQLGDRTSTIGSALQTGAPDSELIDLTAETGTLTAEFSIYREAELDNIIGFFAVENAAGQIRNQKGELLSPGQVGYVEAAIRNRIAVELSGTNQKTTRYTAQIEGGQLLSSFIANSNSLENLSDADSLNDPNVFFVHASANSDRQDHVRLLGDNTFGFEDSINGGDQDFNDLIVKVNFSNP